MIFPIIAGNVSSSQSPSVSTGNQLVQLKEQTIITSSRKKIKLYPSILVRVRMYYNHFLIRITSKFTLLPESLFTTQFYIVNS